MVSPIPPPEEPHVAAAEPAAPASPPAPAEEMQSPAPPSEAKSSEPASPEPAPSVTESAALDPIALPPAANDGSTRYGIEIGAVEKQDGLRPFSSAVEAEQACALFKKASRPCEATVYAGDSL